MNNNNFVVVKIDSDRDSSSESPSLRLTLKRVGMNKPAEFKIDPDLKDFQSEDKVQLVNIDTAPQERSEVVVPFKKRRFGGENSVTHICKVEGTQVLKQSVAVKKTHKSESMSCDESGAKKERQDKKKQQQQQQPKAELPQPTNEPSSSQMTHTPCQDGARTGTSDEWIRSSTEQTSRPKEFWVKELQKTFELEDSKRFQPTQFTEEQNEILQEAIVALFRNMDRIEINRGRFLKTHKCKRCEFSITHQCMPLDFFRTVRFGTEFMDQTNIAPSEIVVCNCGFAFCHSHLKRSRIPVLEGIPGRLTLSLREYERSVDVTCAKCCTTVVMTNRTKKICSDLNIWDGITDANRQTFYDRVQNSPNCAAINPPSVDNFYACSKSCCLTYHRCSRTDKVPAASITSPG